MTQALKSGADKVTATVLVVDDEELLREAVAFDLRRKGYRVLTAGCGNEAITVLAAQKVDVVVTDVRMPNGSGIDLLEHIKGLDAFSPAVIFITGFADISLEEAYDRGVDSVFPKPFDRAALLEAVSLAVAPGVNRYNRKSIRVTAELQVDLHSATGTKLPAAQIVNVGRGGFFARFAGPFPKPGELVEFSLGTNEIPPIRGTGIVRWVREESDSLPTGCGIEIVSLAEDDRRQFFSFINSAKTRAFIPLK